MDFVHPFTDRSFFLIAGPCVIESRGQADFLAAQLQSIAKAREIPFIFKASFDKANRTSINSFRGLGIIDGLEVLSDLRSRYKIPVITDVHEISQCVPASEVVDVLQIPAFLCRQTDLLHAAAGTGCPVNIKKGQFLAPWDMHYAVQKVVSVAGHGPVWVTERGSSFGYGNLVVDFQSFSHLRKTGCPVIFDATHSVQRPGAMGSTTGGNRSIIPDLARAAATAVDGFFFEVHENPSKALSDGPNSISLDKFDELLEQLIEIWRTGRRFVSSDFVR